MKLLVASLQTTLYKKWRPEPIIKTGRNRKAK